MPRLINPYRFSGGGGGGGAPTVRGINTHETPAGAGTETETLPVTANADDLIVVFRAHDGTPTAYSSPTPVESFTLDNGVKIAVDIFVAAGSETTFGVPQGPGGKKQATIIAVIDGADTADPTVTAVQTQSPASGTTVTYSSFTPDSYTALLVVVAAMDDRDDTTVSTYPYDDTNKAEVNANDGISSSAHLAVDFTTVESGSETPPDFVFDQTEDLCGMVFEILPA